MNLSAATIKKELIELGVSRDELAGLDIVDLRTMYDDMTDSDLMLSDNESLEDFMDHEDF